MNRSFDLRMKELDEIVALCVDQGPFATGVVRDASNRSSRDGPWWGVQIERSQTCGSQTRRVTATVTLHASETGESGRFEGRWRARVWQGVGVDTFQVGGSHPLAWRVPTADALQEALAGLLQKAEAALPPRTRA
ncbi:hypothetical protein [Aureimonas sp. ME7]|uniref:hypothetical protein n=1 Tax=Aureimonas sp. ME7 TaxID=2744252 RepID=UPI0015F51E11|nr:hypothetical protein [Aureimonas sp. ME7]